ncbi:MAG: di/tricarboxylate transporter [Phenylobacterium sp.]|jgi:di/tricarboxylate transporter
MSVGFEQLALIAIMISLVVALIATSLSPALLFFSAVIISFLAGLIELDVMLANFTNTSLITLMMLLTASLAIEKTRLISWLGAQIARGSLTNSIVRLGLSSALLSSFINNTAVVATMINGIKENTAHAPSKLLLPLSYTAILGGTLTLIGTSTNLIVNGFVEDAGLEPLGFFDFTLVGLSVLTMGLITIIIFARKLPEYEVEQEEEAPFYLDATVTEQSGLIGKTVEQNELRHLKALFLAEIIRGGERIVPVGPDEIIRAGDKLQFVGDINSAHRLAQFTGLQLVHPEHELSAGSELVEVVISHSGDIAGNTLKQFRFREQFDAAVIAIRRGHTRLEGGLGTVKLQAGDSLILAPGKHFKDKALNKEFVYVSGVELKHLFDLKTSISVIAGFMVALLASISGLLSLEKGLLLLLVGYLFSGVITLKEAQRRFPMELFVIVGSAIGLAQLMINTGVAQLLTDALMYYVNGWGPLGAFIAIYLLTLILTELITNNAAAALVFPIAYSLSTGFDVSPMPFIMAVVFGASASFISPYGYQTNLMVYSAGQYRFRDYLVLGIPTSIAYSATALFMIPTIFPF